MKKPTAKDLEEVLEHEEFTPEDYLLQHYPNDVLKFILFFNIQSGTEKVLRSTVYKLYQTWSKDPVLTREWNEHINSLLVQTDSKVLHLNTPVLRITQQTLELLEPKRQIPAKKHPLRHFENYLKYYNLEKGKNWIELFVLRYLYDNWIHKNKTNALSHKDFTDFINVYFETRTHCSKKGNMLYVSVNQDSLLKHITIEEINQLREGYERKRKK